MSLINVIVLAVVQGLAELLPVSSSAHVVVAEKIMGLDPSSPPMTLLLVMLHTGTMVAVIVYFWPQWRRMYFQSAAAFKDIAARAAVATALTAVVGGVIIKVIEHTLLRGRPHSEIEDLFGHLEFIAPALAAAGLLILAAGLRAGGAANRAGGAPDGSTEALTLRRAGLIGMVQGLCLPFRGLSRSGATISAGMLLGVDKARAEAFSFALAVLITPPVVIREVLRLMRSPGSSASALSSAAWLCALGAALAFLAGLIALKWLSRWLETGRWYLFGLYCLAASAVVALLHARGY